MNLRVGGYRGGMLVWAITLTMIVGISVWLFYPVFLPRFLPDKADLEIEGLAVTIASAVLLVVLGISIWVKSSRESNQIGVLLALVMLNALLREPLNLGSGLEFNYVIPLITGVACGGPAGFFVGAASCLLSQLSMNLVIYMMPSQMLVWGFAGIIGGMFVGLPTFVAWLAALVSMAIVFGPVSMMVYNILGWLTTTEAAYSFMPYAPVMANLENLYQNGVETSIGIDLTRAFTTAFCFLIIGYPSTVVLRTALHPKPVAQTPPEIIELRPSTAAKKRREKIRRVTRMWVER